jgi:hypothetical protein
MEKPQEGSPRARRNTRELSSRITRSPHDCRIDVSILCNININIDLCDHLGCRQCHHQHCYSISTATASALLQHQHCYSIYNVDSSSDLYEFISSRCVDKLFGSLRRAADLQRTCGSRASRSHSRSTVQG